MEIIMIKILALACALIAGILGYFVFKYGKLIDRLYEENSAILHNIAKLEEGKIYNETYQRATMLLVQGLYNNYSKGGSLRKSDIEFIQKFLDGRSDYKLKLNIKN